jgi:hypothetical protein
MADCGPVGLGVQHVTAVCLEPAPDNPDAVLLSFCDVDSDATGVAPRALRVPKDRMRDTAVVSTGTSRGAVMAVVQSTAGAAAQRVRSISCNALGVQRALAQAVAEFERGGALSHGSFHSIRVRVQTSEEIEAQRAAEVAAVAQATKEAAARLAAAREAAAQEAAAAALAAATAPRSPSQDARRDSSRALSPQLSPGALAAIAQVHAWLADQDHASSSASSAQFVEEPADESVGFRAGTKRRALVHPRAAARAAVAAPTRAQQQAAHDAYVAAHGVRPPLPQRAMRLVGGSSSDDD